MALSNYLGGTLNFKIDGAQYRVAGSFRYSMGGKQRTAKNGPDGTLGFITTYKEPMIDSELVADGTITQQQLRQITNSTLTVELDNGITVLLANAWQEGDIETDAVEAKMGVKFAGLSAQELTS